MPNNIANKLASRKLFRRLGLPANSHSLLRENLEHYNSQLSSPIKDVAELEGSNVSRPGNEERWLRKLKRDIGKPYSDGDAARHRVSLDNDMSELKQALKTEFPGKVYVVGGVTKGRFGGNSDYDVVGQGFISDGACQSLADQGWYVWTHFDDSGNMVRQSAASETGVNAEFFPHSDFSKAIGFFGKGPELELGDSSPSQFLSLIQKGYRAKGLDTNMGDTTIQIGDTASAKRNQEPSVDFPQELRNSARVKTWERKTSG